MAGRVRVGVGDGARLDRKPGDMVDPDTIVLELVEAAPYVSRGGEKLAGALDAFGVDPRGPGLPGRRRVAPVASPTACCSAARRVSMLWTWDADSSRSRCAAMTHAWCPWSGPTRRASTPTRRTA